jgi:hypothetical protein
MATRREERGRKEVIVQAGEVHKKPDVTEWIGKRGQWIDGVRISIPEVAYRAKNLVE